MTKITKILTFSLLLFSFWDLAAAISVSRIMLKNGSSLQSSVDSYAVLECQIDNPDKKDCELELILQAAERNFSEDNVNSWRVHIPAKSSLYFRGNVKIARQENYELTVYANKVRLGRKADQSLQIKLADAQKRFIGIWNDSGNSPGGLSKHKHLKDKLFAVFYSKNSFPVSARQLQDCRSLLIIRPDFKQYTSKDFAFILEYAANGGSVIFADPRGVLEASKTPLSIMLPVIPLGVRKTSSNAFLTKLFPEIRKGSFPDCKEAELLESAVGDKEGVTFAEYENQMLYRQGKFGLGTVRVLAFSPEDEAFAGNWKVGEKTLSLLCRLPAVNTNDGAAHAPLDMLTGFSVLPLWVVRNIILAYFLLLGAVLFLGYHYKKHVLAWFGCAFIAFIAGGVILFVSAKMTDKKKNCIMSSIEIVNGFYPGSVQKDYSVYTSKKTDWKTTGDVSSIFSAMSPPKNPFGYYAGLTASYYREPLKRGSSSDGRGTVEMTIFPKSSKRYTVNASAKDLFCLQDSLELPLLHISGKNMVLKNFVLPNYEKAEGIFFVFPGGTKSGTLSGDGVCQVDWEEGMLLSDPMLDSLRKSTALVKGDAAPFLAAVFSVQEHEAHQGKKILLYPLQTVFSGEKVHIPSCFISLAPANHTSRMMFDGPFLLPGYDIMAENNPELQFSLPGVFRNIIPEEVEIYLEYSGRGQVTAYPELLLPGKKRGIKGVQSEEQGVFIFRSEELKNILDKDSVSGRIVVRSELTDSGRMASSTSANTCMWQIRKLAISVKGSLPQKNKKIRF